MKSSSVKSSSLNPIRLDECEFSSDLQLDCKLDYEDCTGHHFILMHCMDLVHVHGHNSSRPHHLDNVQGSLFGSH